MQVGVAPMLETNGEIVATKPINYLNKIAIELGDAIQSIPVQVSTTSPGKLKTI